MAEEREGDYKILLYFKVVGFLQKRKG